MCERVRWSFCEEEGRRGRGRPHGAFTLTCFHELNARSSGRLRIRSTAFCEFDASFASASLLAFLASLLAARLLLSDEKSASTAHIGARTKDWWWDWW